MDVHPRSVESVQHDTFRTNGVGSLVSNQTATFSPRTESTSPTDLLQTRLSTYKGWNSKQSSLRLATAGFVYTGIGDKVECQTCGVRIYNWQDHEDPVKAHKTYAPDCTFMSKNFPNVPAPPKPKKIFDVKYPHYSEYRTRLQTFASWPLKCVAQNPDIMARSGFYYIGSADRARCFYCGVTLRDWDSDDYPPCAHRQWSENCPFVQALDVEGMREEIEEMERSEKLNKEMQNSHFFDCSSSRKRNKMPVADVVEADGVGGSSSEGATAQVYSQVSDKSNEGSGYNTAIQAVVEMGYSIDVVEKALEMKRREGIMNPDAVCLYSAILDMEG